MNRDSQLRLLVVEDNPTIQRMIYYLLRTDYTLHIVSGAAEALDAASQYRFDLFLLDINLGADLDGVELLAALRRLPGHAETPAIACTAFVMQQDRLRILASGFEGFIGKPFTRTTLAETLQTVGRRLMQHAREVVAPPTAFAA